MRTAILALLVCTGVTALVVVVCVLDTFLRGAEAFK